MRKNMGNLMKILIEENQTCVVEQHGVIYKDIKRGIVPILTLLDEGKLQDARLADKVIGKAAAMMMCYGGVQEVETLLISEPAHAFFMSHHISVKYHEVVPYIINRQGDGMCPMEACVLTIEDMGEAHTALLNTLESMKKSAYNK